MKRPLFERVKAFRGDANFAMPGHKGHVDFDFSLRDDLTEIVGADNLLDPKGAIRALQEEIAEAYVVEQSILVPAGSTTGIKIALYLAARPGGKVLAQRNSHIALFHAAVSLDLRPVYLEAEVDEATGLFCGVGPEAVAEALDRDPEITAVFLTSPDYFGGILNLERIAEEVHKRGKKLVVDEAHGAHLAFSSLSSYSAVRHADYTVQSLHKTAPALTGAALLHLKETAARERLLKGMRLFLSTSPSYLTMLSSEYAVSSMASGYDEGRVVAIREALKGPVQDMVVVEDRPGFVARDPAKLLFHMKGRRGDEVVTSLAKAGVHLEMGDSYYALAILSPYNHAEDVKKLKRALIDMPTDAEPLAVRVPVEVTPEVALSPREAFFAETERVPLREAEGRVAAENITPYPPGIPIVGFGERVTEAVIRSIDGARRLIGLDDGRIRVVKEEQ